MANYKNNNKNTSQKKTNNKLYTKVNTAKKQVNFRQNAKKVVKETAKSPLKIIPLGGLEEIGKNCTVFEYENEMIVVDCGLAFPDDEMLGIDIVIPDLTYLKNNKDKIKGIFITHGHEDHIGAVPYLLKEIDAPVYSRALTLGLIEGKLEEHGISNAKLVEKKPGDVVKCGKFTVEFIHVNHSIPDAVAFAITTPVGTVLMTGDFKFDSTPINGEMIDIARISQLGKEGVLALLSDSTNAERAGITLSEKTVGASFENLFKSAKKDRIIVATFSSNIHRMQQIIDEAVKCGRKVAVSGRSMTNVVEVATRLGYLSIPQGVLIDIKSINSYAPHQLVIITTGSQGEPMSALHDVHVSGHACKEELKIMLAMVNPKFFIPVHGEQKQLAHHKDLAKQVGIKEKNILLSENGKVIELTKNSVTQKESVHSGRVLVDGYGVGDVGSIVLRDRKHLAEDGIIIPVMTIDSATGEVVSGPDIVSRGFVYVRESEELMNDIKETVYNSIDKLYNNDVYDWVAIKTKIRDDLSRFLYERTRRSPMILPIIMEI